MGNPTSAMRMVPVSTLQLVLDQNSSDLKADSSRKGSEATRARHVNSRCARSTTGGHICGVKWKRIHFFIIDGVIVEIQDIEGGFGVGAPGNSTASPVFFFLLCCGCGLLSGSGVVRGDRKGVRRGGGGCRWRMNKVNVDSVKTVRDTLEILRLDTNKKGIRGVDEHGRDGPVKWHSLWGCRSGVVHALPHVSSNDDGILAPVLQDAVIADTNKKSIRKACYSLDIKVFVEEEQVGFDDSIVSEGDVNTVGRSPASKSADVSRILVYTGTICCIKDKVFKSIQRVMRWSNVVGSRGFLAVFAPHQFIHANVGGRRLRMMNMAIVLIRSGDLKDSDSKKESRDHEKPKKPALAPSPWKECNDLLHGSGQS